MKNGQAERRSEKTTFFSRHLTFPECNRTRKFDEKTRKTAIHHASKLIESPISETGKGSSSTHQKCNDWRENDGGDGDHRLKGLLVRRRQRNKIGDWILSICLLQKD